jgi:mono/diheme cytochrome c family protein
MWYQAKVTPNDPDESGIFKDGTSNRPVPRGAVARGWSQQDESKYTGYEGNQLTNKFPSVLVLDGERVNTDTEMIKVMKRGKERYYIYCSHCHGQAGDGQGMITQRGLVLKRQPATYHTDRLREMPLGHFYDVITNGFGIMYSQSSRVLPDDRWAIAAYIRALQLSQEASKSDLDATDLSKLEEAKNPPAKEDKAHKEGAH